MVDRGLRFLNLCLKVLPRQRCSQPQVVLQVCLAMSCRSTDPQLLKSWRRGFLGPVAPHVFEGFVLRSTVQANRPVMLAAGHRGGIEHWPRTRQTGECSHAHDPCLRCLCCCHRSRGEMSQGPPRPLGVVGSNGWSLGCLLTVIHVHDCGTKTGIDSRDGVRRASWQRRQVERATSIRGSRQVSLSARAQSNERHEKLTPAVLATTCYTSSASESMCAQDCGIEWRLVRVLVFQVPTTLGQNLVLSMAHLPREIQPNAPTHTFVSTTRDVVRPVGTTILCQPFQLFFTAFRCVVTAPPGSSTCRNISTLLFFQTCVIAHGTPTPPCSTCHLLTSTSTLEVRSVSITTQSS